MMLRRRNDEPKEPIASRTRSASSRSGVRFRQEHLREGPSDLEDGLDDDLLTSLSDSDSDGDDTILFQLRRSNRTFAPPHRFAFDSDDTSTDNPDEPDASREERRSKSKLLKVLRRPEPSEDGDEVSDFLTTRSLQECQTYHDRHLQLEGRPPKPPRVVLYDLLPSMSATNAKAVFERIKQLEDSDPFSSEGSKLAGWVKTALSVPYGVRRPLPSDDDALLRISRAMDQAVWGQAAAKDAMLQAAAQMMAAPDGVPPILAFVGPPGVGKTTLARALGGAIGLPYFQLNAGGSGDRSVWAGHSLTYEGSQPGCVLQGVRRCGALNPLIFIDEFEKISSRHGNELGNFMIHLLDDSQRHEFVDEYLDLPIDLSGALFVLALNDLEAVDSVLRNRIQEVHFVAPDQEGKIAIAQQHLVPSALRNCALKGVRFADADLAHVIARCEAEPGVRNLKRAIARAVNRINVLRRGGDRLDLSYSGVDVAGEVRVTPDLFDRLTRGDKAPERPNAHMYA